MYPTMLDRFAFWLTVTLALSALYCFTGYAGMVAVGWAMQIPMVRRRMIR